MATLTTWEAEKGGYFLGTATPGQLVGRAIDWALEKVRKLPQLPKIEPNKGHWKTWADGEPIGISEEWITKMIQEGRLPGRDQVTYSGAHTDKAVMRAMTGTHVIVEMLNTDRQTRHRCILLDNVLVAAREGWEASLKRAA
jgi:hypothetical protein